jgi:hypothetical protein
MCSWPNTSRILPTPATGYRKSSTT